MWNSKVIEFGKVTFSDCSVFLWESMHSRIMLSNPPSGKIVNAYWRGTTLVVEREDGWVYNYTSNGPYSSLYHK